MAVLALEKPSAIDTFFGGRDKFCAHIMSTVEGMLSKNQTIPKDHEVRVTFDKIKSGEECLTEIFTLQSARALEVDWDKFLPLNNITPDQQEAFSELAKGFSYGASTLKDDPKTAFRRYIQTQAIHELGNGHA